MSAVSIKNSTSQAEISQDTVCYGFLFAFTPEGI
jgi:hypothetical protein